MSRNGNTASVSPRRAAGTFSSGRPCDSGAGRSDSFMVDLLMDSRRPIRPTYSDPCGTEGAPTGPDRPPVMVAYRLPGDAAQGLEIQCRNIASGRSRDLRLSFQPAPY